MKKKIAIALCAVVSVTAAAVAVVRRKNKKYFSN